ncbi:toll/interleukin-1 receptor domain-containing protein [Anaerosinus massiliensis]|uniref:toll/interleukin-1 receptor domain-containing protein n=1 Tax=Massilibacillus massiliensis TaxID=1806837 RepID=UPI000DA63C20|nr:toll/interleukin-1 receptor domain-containing protein [Massilibacillus massiliensis]
MPSIFLSHSSVDKAFVEKLAKDLKRLGVNAWFDKWEIKVGESITWKIEEGIRENEYLGIILSNEALESEWVKSEISAGWIRQMQTKKIFILPIYYRQCSIPYFLADRKYADFRKNYQDGLEELTSFFNISNVDTISTDNWRKFTKTRNNDGWKKFREDEYSSLVTTLVNRAKEYNWSVWVGGTKNKFSITLRGFINLESKMSISIRLDGKSNAYKATFYDNHNPNNIPISNFDIYVGNTVNECEEFVWRRMEDFKQKYGNPTEEATYFTQKILGEKERYKFAYKIMKSLDWYKK